MNYLSEEQSNAYTALINLHHHMMIRVPLLFPKDQMVWPCSTGYRGVAHPHERGVVLILHHQPGLNTPELNVISYSIDNMSEMPSFDGTELGIRRMMDYLINTFSLGNFDMAINIPIDLKDWNGDFVELESNTQNFALASLEVRMDAISSQLPRRQTVNNVNTTGNNNNVVVDSENVVINQTHELPPVYDQMILAAREIQIENDREEIISAIEAMKENHGSSSFMELYQTFIGKVANHMTVFSTFMAPLTIAASAAI